MNELKTVSLDSSTLVWLKRAFDDREEQAGLVEALDALHDAGWLVVFTGHQFVELLSHENDEEASSRLHYLSWLCARRGVGWIAAGGDRPSLGMVPHITAVEVAAIVDGVPANQLRSHVLSLLLRDSNPPAVEFNDLETLRPLFQAQMERAREVSSIVMTTGPSPNSETIGELRRLGTRTPSEAQRMIRAQRSTMADELRQSGDKRLEEHEAIAQSFLDSAAHDIPLELRANETGADALIRSFGLDPERIPDEMRFSDLTYFAEFQQKARLAAEHGGLAEVDVANLEMEQIPTIFLQNQLRLARVRSGSRARGGDLADSYLASLSYYLDLVIADKQTTELMNQVRRTIPYDQIGEVRRIPRGAHVADLPELVGGQG